MNLQELLKKGLIRKIGADGELANELLTGAANDLKVAQDNFNDSNFGWSLAIAYNAMLTAGRALMAKEGYGTFSDGHHLAVVQFCTMRLGADASDLTHAFNRYRVRRHGVLYGQSLPVGENEAKTAIENAKLFTWKIRAKF